MKFRKLTLLISLVVTMAMFASMNLFAEGTIESDGTNVMENQSSSVTLATLRGESSENNEMTQTNETQSTTDGVILFIPRRRYNTEELNSRTRKIDGSGYRSIENQNSSIGDRNQRTMGATSQSRVMSNSMVSGRIRSLEGNKNQSYSGSLNNKITSTQRFKHSHKANISHIQSLKRNSSSRMMVNNSSRTNTSKTSSIASTFKMNNRSAMQNNKNFRVLKDSDKSVYSNTSNPRYTNSDGLGRNANRSGICYYSDSLDSSK